MTADDAPPSKRRKILFFIGRLAVVFIISAVPMMSESQRAAVVHALRDPLAVLSGRSPGERTGALLQTKKKLKLPKGDHLLSEDNVLPAGALTARQPTILAEAPPGAGAPFTLPGQDEGGNALAAAGPLGGGSGAGPGEKVSLGGGGSLGSLGAGGGLTGKNDDGDDGGIPLRPTDNPDKPPVLAVPEPASWATLLTGFFLLGGIMRRKRRHHDRPMRTR